MRANGRLPAEPTVRPWQTWARRLRGEFGLPVAPDFHLLPALWGPGKALLLPFTAFKGLVGA